MFFKGICTFLKPNIHLKGPYDLKMETSPRAWPNLSIFLEFSSAPDRQECRKSQKALNHSTLEHINSWDWRKLHYHLYCKPGVCCVHCALCRPGHSWMTRSRCHSARATRRMASSGYSMLTSGQTYCECICT